MRKRIALAVMAAICCALIASAQDNKINELTAEERASGWRLLFDGKTPERMARLSSSGTATRVGR